MRQSLVILGVIFALCALTTGLTHLEEQSPEIHPSEPYRKSLLTFLSAPEYLTFRDAKRVEVFRIKSVKVKPGETAEPTIHGYPVINSGGLLTPEQSEELKGIVEKKWLLEPRELGHPCGFDPGVVFRLNHEGQTLDIIICFHCEDWQFYHSRHQEDFYRHDSFSVVSPRLVSLVKSLFPDDGVVQSIGSDQAEF